MLTFFKLEDDLHPALAISKIARDELLVLQMPKFSTLTLRIAGATDRDVLAYAIAFEAPNGDMKAFPRPIGPLVIPRSFAFQIVPEAEDRAAGALPSTVDNESRTGQSFFGSVLTTASDAVKAAAAAGVDLAKAAAGIGSVYVATTAFWTAILNAAVPINYAVLEVGRRLGPPAPELADMQRKLTQLGYGQPSRGDVPLNAIEFGYMTPNTVTLIRRFQRDNGLPLTGIFDRATVDAINVRMVPTMPSTPAPPLACSELFTRWQSAVRMGQNAAVVARLKQLHATCCADMYRRWQEAARMGQNAAVVARLKQLYEQGCREALSASATPSRGGINTSRRG